MSAAADKLLALLHGGTARVEGRKPGPFMSTKYVLQRKTWDDSLGQFAWRDDDSVTISPRTIEQLIRSGLLDGRGVIETFTQNATRYLLPLTPMGVATAQSVALSQSEVSHAG